MPNNPSPDEPTEVIEPLQRKQPVPQTPASPPPAAAARPAAASVSQSVGVAGADSQDREEALTVKFAIGKLNDLLQWSLTVFEALLLIRFVLRMFGADPENPFAIFIFAITTVLRIPFTYNGTPIIPEPGIGHSVNQAFEFTTIFAAGIYLLLFFALKRFLRILVSNPGEQGE